MGLGVFRKQIYYIAGNFGTPWKHLAEKFSKRIDQPKGYQL